MIPIYKPYMPENISEKVHDILYSGQLAYGKSGREFERLLSYFIGNEKIITTSTYNHALLVALSILGLKAGDEIIASPVSCLASNQPFAVKGLKIKWVDVNPNFGVIDPDHLRSIISKDTKAIFNNLFCGYAGNLEEIYKIGEEYGIPVIDDCIEAFGTEYNGKKVGNTGADISVFSFQTVRLPNTIDGGALAFNSENLYQKGKLIRDYGIDRSKFRSENGEINPDCDIALEGYGATMNEINSLIGIEQMKKIPELINIQRQNAEAWGDFFMNNSVAKPLDIDINVNPNFWVYGVLAEDKNEFLKSMKNEGFYATGVHINNNIYSVFQNDDALKGVDEFMRKFVAIPSGWWFRK